MMVRVYPDGNDSRAHDYALPPLDAVLSFCAEERHGLTLRADLIVEPLDTEARDAAGWHDDGRGPVFRMFKARGRVEWTAEEVGTEHHALADARWTRDACCSALGHRAGALL